MRSVIDKLRWAGSCSEEPFFFLSSLSPKKCTQCAGRSNRSSVTCARDAVLVLVRLSVEEGEEGKSDWKTQKEMLFWIALAQCRLVMQPHPPYTHNMVRTCLKPQTAEQPDLPAYIFTVDKIPSAVLYVEDGQAVHLEYDPARMLLQPGALSAFRTLLHKKKATIRFDDLCVEARLLLETLPDSETCDF